MSRLEACSTCTGSGIKSGTQPSTCSTCNGAGQVVSVTRTPLGAFQQVGAAKGKGMLVLYCACCAQGRSLACAQARHGQHTSPYGVSKSAHPAPALMLTLHCCTTMPHTCLLLSTCTAHSASSATKLPTRSTQPETHPLQVATCPDCEGAGERSTPCSTCGGDGRVRRSKKISLRVPPGVDTGSRLRVRGEGNAGRKGETGHAMHPCASSISLQVSRVETGS